MANLACLPNNLSILDSIYLRDILACTTISLRCMLSAMITPAFGGADTTDVAVVEQTISGEDADRAPFPEGPAEGEPMRKHMPLSRVAAVPAASVFQARAGVRPLSAPARSNEAAPAEPAALGDGTSLIGVPTHSKPVEPAQGAGLPSRLRAGLESLSGLAMDDVRIHRNSPEPERLGALAYARGSDIHLGPGQDRHLPHEAWHVVQQKQGRVAATAQMKGLALNDDAGLEAEADRMGERASLAGGNESTPAAPGAESASASRAGTVQLAPKKGNDPKGSKPPKLSPSAKYEHEFRLANAPPIDVTLGMTVESKVGHEIVEAMKDKLDDATTVTAKTPRGEISNHINVELKDVYKFWKSGKLDDLVTPKSLSGKISTDIGYFNISTKVTPFPLPTIEATFKPKEDLKISDGKGSVWTTSSEYVLKAVKSKDPDNGKPDAIPVPSYGWNPGPAWEKFKNFAIGTGIVTGAAVVGTKLVELMMLLGRVGTTMVAPMFIMPGSFDQKLGGDRLES
jgi:Domain of unknown function (DUF4157)